VFATLRKLRVSTTHGTDQTINHKLRPWEINPITRMLPVNKVKLPKSHLKPPGEILFQGVVSYQVEATENVFRYMIEKGGKEIPQNQ
jgi:hypothetical protein